jgi:tmRNA-binding protein
LLNNHCKEPVPQFSYNTPQTQMVSSSESVVQLSENRIAIVDTNINSGMRGEVFVLEFDETKKLLISLEGIIMLISSEIQANTHLKAGSMQIGVLNLMQEFC